MANIMSAEAITAKIFEIRGKKVMIDRDLALLYGVETRTLNQAVRRNTKRFPEDFMFQLSQGEAESLRSQFVILKKSEANNSKRGKHIKYLPYAFTEQGVAMLSGVLNSVKAVRVNIEIMRAFVKLRHIVSASKQFEMKLRELEDRLEMHDKDIHDIFEAIRQLMGIPHEHRKIGGFTAK